MEQSLDDLGYLLNQAVRVLRADLAERLRSVGITPAQWAVLADLAHAEDDRRPGAVAARVGYDRATMSGVVSRLAEAGWIAVEPHPSDRRSVLLALTPRARAVLPELAAAAGETGERAVAGFSAEEREAFLGHLRRVIENLR